MPIKILENNERIAEVQFICDCCGQLVQTSLVKRGDLESQNNKTVKCWRCKQAESANKTS